MKNFRVIFQYLKKQKRFAFMQVFFDLMFVIFNLLSLLIIMPFLDLIFGEKSSVVAKPVFSWNKEYFSEWFSYNMQQFVEPGNEKQALALLCVLIVILYFLKNLFRYLAMVCMANIRHGVAANLRKNIYDKITSLPLSFFSNEKKGDIMARSTGDVIEIELSIIGSLEMIFKDPLSIVLTLLFLFIMSPSLTLFALVLMPISALIIGFVGKSLRRTSLKGQNKAGELLAYLEESLLQAINVRMLNKKDIASPLSEFLGALVLVLIVWYGGSLILESNGNKGLRASEFITFILLFSQILRPIQNIAKAWTNVNKGLASMDRVNKILNANNHIADKVDAKSIDDLKDRLTFKNVHFSYDESPLLQDINLTLEKGKTIALVGESGGGKSTLIDLVTRFYDIQSGEIAIDNTDIRQLKIKDLRNLFGIVSQKAILFNDSIFNNIAFGLPNASKEDVEFAAKVANAHEFISKMDGGYDSIVGDEGDNLSGGQKQRISIARAILRNPPILLLDEATSALDTESEKLVQDALEKLLENRTSMVVAHRLSTIKNADEIIVIQQGKIAERGKHNELIQADGIYNRLIKMQNVK